jgi:hypothetical protein
LKAEEKETQYTPQALEKATNTTPAKAQSKLTAIQCVVEVETNCQSSKQETDEEIAASRGSIGNKRQVNLNPFLVPFHQTSCNSVELIFKDNEFRGRCFWHSFSLLSGEKRESRQLSDEDKKENKGKGRNQRFST